jgi:hypothetical protein
MYNIIEAKSVEKLIKLVIEYVEIHPDSKPIGGMGVIYDNIITKYQVSLKNSDGCLNIIKTYYQTMWEGI